MKLSAPPRSSYYTEKKAYLRNLLEIPFTSSLIKEIEADQLTKHDLYVLGDREPTNEVL